MTNIDDLTQLFDRMAEEAPEPLTLPRGTEGKIRGARLRRYASIGLVSVLVTAGIILPLKALLLAGDRDKPTPPAGGTRSDLAPPSDSLWPSAPPITVEMLGLPKDWDGLSGQALADHLNLKQSDSKTCDGVSSGGWCTESAGDLTQAQSMGLLILLNGESFDSPVSQSRLAYALISDAKRTGDVARAADLNWLYVERPRILQNEAGSAVTPPAPVTPAAPGEDTYVFSNISFTYPYVPDGVKGATPDEGFASLIFESDWSGDVYPGEANCEARFLSADGTDVGGLTGGWAQLTPHIGGRERAFPVTAVPARVSWACSSGVKPSSGVTLENLYLEKRDDGLHLIATLHAPSVGETGPGTQVCEIKATAADGGEVVFHNGSIEVPDGTRLDLGLPDTFDGATDLQSSCRPFTGEGGQ